MATRDRSGADHLTHIERLIENPESYHIFLALRVIEAEYNDAPRLGMSKRPHEDAYRLGQEAELAFPRSTIRSVTSKKGDEPGELINRFFGFFGPHGPLPIHLTEYARERQINMHDPTFVAFANMLTHRMMSLLYRAWAAGQPTVGFDRGDASNIERNIAALAGMYGTELNDRDEMPDLAKRHFAGLLSMGPKNAEGLIAVLSSFYRTEVNLQDFIGSWLELEPDDQWQLGSDVGLGQATSIGSRVWSRATKFRLCIGPVSLEEYLRLLPDNQSLKRLTSVVRNYVGDALDWDVNIILKGDEVPSAVLGEDTRLGHTSWIGERKTNEDAADLFLEPLNYIHQAA
jgi:type VI secretion system protein ImpH